MTRYLIEFERIGRNHGVPPVTVEANGEADLCRQIRAVARKHLASPSFDVLLEYAEDGETVIAGWFACGMHSGGNFAVTARAGEAA